MLIEKVRKEICLLLFFAITISLAFSQTIYEVHTEAAVQTHKGDLKNTRLENANAMTSTLPDPAMALNDPDFSEHDETETFPSSAEPAATENTTVSGGALALNTENLYLIASGDPYELTVANAVQASYALSAEEPPIATLSNETAQSVTITPQASGHTRLIVTALGRDGNQVTLTCQIVISDLSLSEEAVDIYLNDENPAMDIAVQGIDLDAVYYGSGNIWTDESIRDAMTYGKQCTIKVGNPKVADAWFSDGYVHIKPIAKGITNVRMNIYGVPLSIRINVHHYTLNRYVINTYMGSPMKNLKLKGAGNHNITWVSGNNHVASVSKTGLVTIKGIGTTKITAKVNGRKVMCIVSVSSKTAYRVVNDARSISKKKNIRYSQQLRMSKNYYDCSSLVYRCYRPYGIRFGYTHPTWAPTAADEGRWCMLTGHQLATQAVEILSCKLVPGDTIYYSFNRNNGRYLDIDHTAIFAGYAYDPLIGYYGTVIEASSTSNTVTERMYYASESIRLIGRPSKK